MKTKKKLKDNQRRLRSSYSSESDHQNSSSSSPHSKHGPFVDPLTAPLSSSDHRTSRSNAGDQSSSGYCKARRSSSRIQNMQKSAALDTRCYDMADSAYEGDEESATPGSSPIDPYDIEQLSDDRPTTDAGVKKKKISRKKCTSRQRKGVKKSAATSENVQLKKFSATSQSTQPIPTSTPVLKTAGTSVSGIFSSGTPKVTPILPTKSQEVTSPLLDDFTTPQIPRSARKRSLLPDHLSDLSINLSFNSQGDSGIGLSPVVTKPQKISHLWSSTEDGSNPVESHATANKVRQEKKGKPSSHIYPQNSTVILAASVQTSDVTRAGRVRPHRKRKNNSDDSCFGFGNSELEDYENLPPARPKANCKVAKKSSPSKDNYRLAHPNSTSGSQSSLEASSSPENPHRSSPALFSETFSTDLGDLKVNKTQDKSYSRLNKIKKTKDSQSDCKMEAWANNFNMEIEDIEKFDLNIE